MQLSILLIALLAIASAQKAGSRDHSSDSHDWSGSHESSNSYTYTVGNGPCRGKHDSIKAAVLAAKEGDKIVLCPGIYLENVNISKTVHLSGAFGGQAILDGQFVVLASATGTTLTHLTFTLTTATYNDLLAVSADNTWIDDCTFIFAGTTDAAVHLIDANNASVTNTRFYQTDNNNGFAIWWESLENEDLTNLTVSMCFIQAAVAFDIQPTVASTGFWLSDSTIQIVAEGGLGLWFDFSDDDVVQSNYTIVDNTFSTKYENVTLLWVPTISYENNTESVTIEYLQFCDNEVDFDDAAGDSFILFLGQTSLRHATISYNSLNTSEASDLASSVFSHVRFTHNDVHVADDAFFRTEDLIVNAVVVRDNRFRFYVPAGTHVQVIDGDLTLDGSFESAKNHVSTVAASW